MGGRLEQHLEAILDQLAEAVTVLDAHGRRIYANQAAARFLGLPSPERLIDGGADVLTATYDLLDERGRPFPLDRMPGRLLLRGEEPEPALVLHVHRRTGEHRWVVVKASAIRDAEGRVLFAVNVAEDVTGIKRAELRERILSEASKVLSSSLDLEPTLEAVARALVPEVGDACAVHLLDDDGRLQLRSVAHVDHEGAAEVPDLLHSRPPALDELLDRGPVLAPDRLVVPLPGRAGPLGVLSVVTAPSGRSLDERDLALAEEVGRRAAAAVENARVHATRSHIAATLQRSLLPPRLPVVPGMGLAARFRAAGEGAEVGGDFYDLFSPRPGQWILTMGDVTGKGPGAAAVTALARYTMRTAAAYEDSPAGILRRLNETLLDDPQTGRMCTAVCARVEPRAERVAVTVACAGHPPPLVLAGAPVLVAARGTMLGAVADGTWNDVELELHAGDALLFYTDGVTEALGERDRFGMRRLLATVEQHAGAGAEALAAAVDGAVTAFQRGEQRDDMAVLALSAGAWAPTGALIGVSPEDGGTTPTDA